MLQICWKVSSAYRNQEHKPIAGWPTHPPQTHVNSAKSARQINQRSAKSIRIRLMPSRDETKINNWDKQTPVLLQEATFADDDLSQPCFDHNSVKQCAVFYFAWSRKVSAQMAIRKRTNRMQKRKKGPSCDGPFISGAAGRNRTHDPLVRSQVLYPAELQPRKKKL